MNNKIDTELLSICDGGTDILLLGYRVHLTKTELAILKSIMLGDSKKSRTCLVSECFNDRAVKPINVTVHVCNINKKAYQITRRRLIVGSRRDGYRINKSL